MALNVPSTSTWTPNPLSMLVDPDGEGAGEDRRVAIGDGGTGEVGEGDADVTGGKAHTDDLVEGGLGDRGAIEVVGQPIAVVVTDSCGVPRSFSSRGPTCRETVSNRANSMTPKRRRKRSRRGHGEFDQARALAHAPDPCEKHQNPQGTGIIRDSRVCESSRSTEGYSKVARPGDDYSDIGRDCRYMRDLLSRTRSSP